MFDLGQFFADDFELRFSAGSLVLDVGCGVGDQMNEIASQNCRAVGIDIDHQSLQKCRERKLNVASGVAESIPFENGCLDGVVCKVVLPYTRENEAIREFGRVLKAGGRAYLVGHGAGYYLYYLVASPSFKEKFYALRSLVNTWCWLITGQRLPGFLGDTIYQSRHRMSKYFTANSLQLTHESTTPKFLGRPVFIYQIAGKVE